MNTKAAKQNTDTEYRTVTVVDQESTGTGKMIRLGASLRDARTQAGISLRELARRVDVSPSFMSQVERDLASPSVGTLYHIASELNLSIDALMRAPEENAGPVSANQGPSLAAHAVDSTANLPADVVSLPTSGSLPGLQRADDRPQILLGGVTWERLTPDNDTHVEFLRVTYHGGTESCRPDNLQQHGGREYFHILSGSLDVQVAFSRQTLSAGDSINFDSSIPHRFSNPYTEDCTGIWFVVGRQ